MLANARRSLASQHRVTPFASKAGSNRVQTHFAKLDEIAFRAQAARVTTKAPGQRQEATERAHEHPLRRAHRRAITQRGQGSAAGRPARRPARPGDPPPRRRPQALRMRRPLGLPHATAAGGAARTPRPGADPAAPVPPTRCAGGRTRRWHRPVRRRAAPEPGHPAGDGALQPHSRNQPAGPLRPPPAGCAQPGDLPGGGAFWPVLRPRPRPRRSPVQSAAMWRKTLGACTA